MKRVSILLLTLLLWSVVILPAVAKGDIAVIEADSAVRQGVLSNSLSYYIRHNAKPKGQADFYILSDVGAIQEEDDQQGLAHFMEHMAFNGTRNLPDKQVIEYLESVGVKFGANLNAATSWDYTVYMMKDVPVVRDNVVDSAMLILHDWAGFIEPKAEEVDKERGVIKEELRTRDGAGWRSVISLIGALGRDTKYAERNLIGYLEGLSTFDKSVLTRFYHDWYRPDYQAIIIVGDVDVDRVEAELIRRFEDLPAAREGAPLKEVIRVPNNEEPIIEIFTDPELQHSTVQYYIKRDARTKEERRTVAAARLSIVDALIMQMQSSRFDEVVMSADAPILYGGMDLGYVGIIPTMSATSYVVQSVEGGLEAALRECVEQMERTRRYGFQEGEFERERRNLMRSAERQYANRDDRTNNSFVNTFISNYRFGTPIPSAEDEWALDSLLIGEVTLEEVNRRVEELFSDENQVIVLQSPRKEALAVPTEADVLRVIGEVASSEIAPYEDKESSDELLSDDVVLEGSSITKTIVNEAYELEEWVLENGIRVVVKPTTLKADEILLWGDSEGGASVVSEADHFTAMMLPSVLSQSGVGEFSAIELGRQLSGKLATVSSWVSGYSHGFRGSSSPADVETMLQLLYLNFTSPRFSETDFEILRRQLRANAENQELSPDYAASKRFAEVAYGGHPRMGMFDVDVIDGLEFEAFKRVRDELFSDGDNFTFTFVGSVDLQTLRPLVERYIGSLPTLSDDAKMSYFDDNIRPVKGRLRDDFRVSMEQPKVGVQVLLSDRSIDYTLQNIVVAQYFKAALDDLLLKSVREELGGTYGVRVGISITDTPYEHYSLRISYDTNEVQFEQLQSTIFEQLELLAKDGATAEQLAKCREYMLKSFGNTKEHNSGWMGYIKSLYDDGFDYLADYEAAIQSVGSDDVRRMARRILRDKSCIEVVMHPEK